MTAVVVAGAGSASLSENGRNALNEAREDFMPRPSRVTLAKRDRERALKAKQKEKEARRTQRKEEKKAQPRVHGGEDPDLAGMIPGPQPPLD